MRNILSKRSLIGALMIISAALAALTPAHAQGIMVKGVVTDDLGPLPGVSVLIKGTTVGVTTDLDGAFSIQAGAKDILVFSSMGYTSQEIAVGSQKVINVKMLTDAILLQDVVVVGYGVQKK